MFNQARGSERVACTVRIIITITGCKHRACLRPSMKFLVKLPRVSTVEGELSVEVRLRINESRQTLSLETIILIGQSS